MGKTFVCLLSEFPAEGTLLVQGEKGPVAVFQFENKFYATEELCPHRGGPLSEGKREGSQLTCPWHQARFDFTTGEKISGPVHRNLKTYSVEIEQESLYIVE